MGVTKPQTHSLNQEKCVKVEQFYIIIIYIYSFVMLWYILQIQSPGNALGHCFRLGNAIWNVILSTKHPANHTSRPVETIATEINLLRCSVSKRLIRKPPFEADLHALDHLLHTCTIEEPVSSLKKCHKTHNLVVIHCLYNTKSISVLNYNSIKRTQPWSKPQCLSSKPQRKEFQHVLYRSKPLHILPQYYACVPSCSLPSSHIMGLQAALGRLLDFGALEATTPFPVNHLH